MFKADWKGQGGRIILLGDGTEITNEAADADMFDNDEEDKDLDSQVDRSNGSARSERDETPGPASKGDAAKSQASSTDTKETATPENVTAANAKSEQK